MSRLKYFFHTEAHAPRLVSCSWPWSQLPIRFLRGAPEHLPQKLWHFLAFPRALGFVGAKERPNDGLLGVRWKRVILDEAHIIRNTLTEQVRLPTRPISTRALVYYTAQEGRRRSSRPLGSEASDVSRFDLHASRGVRALREYSYHFPMFQHAPHARGLCPISHEHACCWRRRGDGP